ncbi:MAG: FHA domain-containing protein [Deltaproteobacteria bacterium]|nr:FHA domain-containing protein [Deltaproteobacteria bacterium]
MSTVVILLIVAAVAAAVFFARKSAQTPAVARTPAKVEGPKQHFLVALNGQLDGKSWHIGNRMVTVGRAPSNYVQLNEPDVSRMAAQIDTKSGTPKVLDMNSATGIRINGEHTTGGDLSDGDTVTIGGQQFRYHLDGNFQNNAAFGAKDAGKEVSATTMDASQNIVLRAQAAYALHKGDEEAAANELGMPVEKLRDLLKQLEG